jgi:hypothetical protein
MYFFVEKNGLSFADFHNLAIYQRKLGIISCFAIIESSAFTKNKLNVGPSL